MNTFYQINSSTIFLQATVLVVKIIQNESLLDILPNILTLFFGLILLKFYISHQNIYRNQIILLQLVDIAFTNILQKRFEIVGSAKYILIGQFLQKYNGDNLAQSSAHITIVVIIIVYEILYYESDMGIGFSIIGWFLLFFGIPSFFQYKSKQKEEEQIQDPQLPLSIEISQRRDISRYESVKQQDKQQQQMEDLKKSQEFFPQEFYQQILEKHHEGVLILNDNKKSLFMSDSLKKIINAKDKKNIVATLMALKNSNQELKEQERLIVMFQALASKLTSNLEMQEVDDEPPDDFIEQQHALAQSENVQQEFDRLMRNVKEKLSKEVDKKDKKMRFILENYMICQQDLNLMKSFERQQTFQSTYKGPSFFEVIQRPFVFQKIVYILITVKDVTHFNQIRMLQAINENKSQMLAQVAHEFRTPLNCITLFVENLTEILEQSIVDEYLKPISISAKTLLSLVNDLLDVAQLKAGKFKLVHVKMDIAELLQEIQLFLRPQIHSKGNELVLKLNTKSNMLIYSDPNRIRQIIFNLISNANKFTQNGKIIINLLQVNQDLYEISVKDSGVGIEPQDQAKLFQAFSKLDRNKELNTSGVGLGLMISNILAERLCIPANVDNTNQLTEIKGLNVYSEGKDKGTTFTFNILDQYEYLSQWNNQSKYGIRIPEVESENVQKTIKRTKTKLDRQFGDDVLKADIYIMIVDDEPFNVTALSKSLKKKFNVEGFYSGADAIARVAKPLPVHTIILQDIEMPAMDGFEITRQIKHQVGDSVYIIGCSGHDEHIKTQCIEAGMDNYLTKPVRLDQLMKIIDTLF